MSTGFPFAPTRRHVLARCAARCAALTLAVAALAPFANATDLQPAWVGTWGAAPADAAPSQMRTLEDQTVRLIVHTSVKGSQVRIRLSNELGTTPLRIGAAHVALRATGADIVPGTDRPLTFGGRPWAVIPAGAPLLSDPVTLAVPAQADLAVSLHLPGSVQATTAHANAFGKNYVSKSGNHAGAAVFPVQDEMTSWPFLTEVDVSAPGAYAIVALGDSITDGSKTTSGTNRRWPDELARRLQAQGKTAVGIVNRGIGGNRLLRDPGGWPPFGRATLARFDRDVLATAGVRDVIVLIGINDIGHPGTGGMPAAEGPTADDLIAGYRQLIARARARGIRVHGATLTPFEGTTFAGYYTVDKEAVRQAVNRWIRTGGEFDSVLDFDRALRDPEQPARMLPAYDSGDHLHPNDAGMRALAQAVPLELFGDTTAAPR